MQQLQKPKTFSKGMTKDLLPKLEGPEQYNYALNAVMFSSEGELPALSSEPGNSLAIEGFPPTKKIVGTHTVDEDLIVLFVYDPNSEHEIGKYYPKSGQYETYCKGACLNFSDVNPIHAVSRTFSACETLVYFTDDYNPYRVINITSPDYQNIDSNKNIDCDSIRFSPPFTVPNVELEVIDGGNLKVGSYSFAIRYIDKNNVPTTWATYTPYKTVKATAENSPTTAFGSTSDEEHQEYFSAAASKSIKFTLDNLDTSYTYIQIGVIYRGTISGAITDTYLLVPLRFNSSSFTYTFQGGDYHSPITADEILQDFVQVDRVKTHTVSNSRLILGHLSTTKRNWAHFQRHASAIKTEWYGIPDTDFTNAFGKTTFMRDEVYAFGVQYIFSDGSRSPVFHIPGRGTINNTGNAFGYNPLISSQLNQWDSATVSVTDTNYLKDGQSRWQVYNTYTHYSPAGPFGDESTLPTGLMGYHELQRFYPVVPSCDEEGGFFGFDWQGNALEGQKIRHHRIPNMPLENPEPLTNGYPIMRIVPKFTMSDTYPHADIVGHIYLVADRRFDRTIVDKGLLGSFTSSAPQQLKAAHYNTLTFHATKALEEPSPFTGPLREVYYMMEGSNPPYHTEEARVFSLITPRSVRAYKPLSAQLMTIDGIYRNQRNNGSPSLSGAFQAVSERVWTPDQVADFSNMAVLSVYNAFLLPNEINSYVDRRLFSIRDLRLLEASATTQANSVTIRDTLFQNASSNTSIYAIDLVQPFKPGGNLSFYYFCTFGSGSNSLDHRVRGSNGLGRQRILKVTLKNDVAVHSNLEALLYKPITSRVSIKNQTTPEETLADTGDTFISVFEILDYFYFNNFTGLDFPASTLQDLMPNAKKFLVVSHLIQTAIESDYNVSLRLNSSNAKEGNFYPPLELPPPTDVESVARTLNAYIISKVQGEKDNYFIGPQKYFYNLSFDYILPEKSYITYLPSRCVDCESDFPNRVFYSNPSETDTLVDKWRSIPAFNSTEVPFRRSNLKVLKALQNTIYAFSEEAVYMSRANERILTNEGSSVMLGNPTFLSQFESASAEDFPMQGMRSHFDMVDVPQGIVYVDSKGRSVFSISDRAEDLAVKGLKRFFEENARFKLDEQFKAVLGVPYPLYTTFHPLGIGFALGYDPYHKRVLITKKDYEIRKEYVNGLSGSSSTGLWLDLERYRTAPFYYGTTPLVGFPSQYFIDRSFTVSYSFISGAWTAFHSYTPNHYFNDRVFLYSNDVYRHNNTAHGIFYGRTAPFIIDFSISHGPLEQFTPSSLILAAHKYYYEPTSGTYVRTERPFDTLTAYNTNQSSGELTCFYPAGPYVDEPPAQTELYLVDDVYRVSRFRDNTVSNLFPIWTVNTSTFDKEPFTPNINYNTPATEQVRLKDTHISFRLKANNYPNKIVVDFAKLNYYLNPR